MENLKFDKRDACYYKSNGQVYKSDCNSSDGYYYEFRKIGNFFPKNATSHEEDIATGNYGPPDGFHALNNNNLHARGSAQLIEQLKKVDPELTGIIISNA